MPILKDIDVMIDVVKSTPIIETSKGKQSDFLERLCRFTCKISN